MSDEAYVFLDANILLHFQRPDSVDWQKICQVETVYLVIYPLLMTEIDKAKDERPQRYLRDRARRLGVWLRERLSRLDEPIRAGVFFVRDTREPRQVATEHDLEWQHRDDRIIAYAIHYMKTQRNVMISTNDGGLEMRLPDYNIQFVGLSESLQLPPEPDSEKLRADKAERELRELRSRSPEFSVLVNPIELPLTRSIETEEEYVSRVLQRTQDALERNYDINPLFRRFPNGSTKSIHDLNAASQLDSATRYVREHYQWITPRIGIRRVDITVSNNGNAVANNVRIRINPPSSIKLYSLCGFGRPPNRPLLSVLFQEMYCDYPGHFQVGLIPRSDNVGADFCIDHVSGAAQYAWQRISHKDNVTAPGLYISAQVEAPLGQIALEATILCDELASEQKLVLSAAIFDPDFQKF